MLTALDLFAGAGGLSLGLKLAGIRCVGAVETDRFAAETHRLNFPETKVLQRDIRQLDNRIIKKEFAGVDMVVAGPPCQGFSVAGPSQYGMIDPRNRLIFEVFRFIETLRPEVAILENVKGILNGAINKKDVQAIPLYINKLEKIGYTSRIFVLQTANFGVPQWRERAFIISAKDPKKIPVEINGNYSEKNWISVRDALSDLPQIKAGEGTNDVVPYATKIKTEYQRMMRKKSKGVANHCAMKHTKRLIERFKHIPVGGSLVDAPPEYGQRQRNGNKLDVRQRFKMNNSRLDPSKISTAITASFQSNFIHYSLHRNLTAREGARLQSFPDWFIFYGPRTLMSKKLLMRENRKNEIGLSQYNQIGNSVPPLLAEGVCTAVKRLL